MKFQLSNSSGSVYPLNGENGAWLTNEAGFGLSNSVKYSDAKQGFFYRSGGEDQEQQTITGNVILKGRNPQALYESFINFCLANKDNLLFDAINGAEKKTRRVDVKFLTKQTANINFVSVSASFSCKTPWYKTQESVISSAGAVSFAANVAMDIPFTFAANGTLVNPVIDGGAAGKLSITGTVNGLRYNSIPGERKITDANGNDLINLADITLNPFFMVPKDGGSVTFPSGGTVTKYYYSRAV